MGEIRMRGMGGGAPYEVIIQTVTVEFSENNYNAILPNPFGRVGKGIKLYGGGDFALGTMAFFCRPESSMIIVHCTGGSSRYNSFYVPCIQSASQLTLQLDERSQYWPTISLNLTLAFLMEK